MQDDGIAGGMPVFGQGFIRTMLRMQYRYAVSERMRSTPHQCLGFSGTYCAVIGFQRMPSLEPQTAYVYCAAQNMKVSPYRADK